MNRKKILILAASTLTAAAIAVGGTLAYFTSTKTATNTFTVGKISISMDEAAVKHDGINWVANTDVDRVTEGNTYTSVMPGSELTKDPTITVTKGSEDCYVGMKIVVSNFTASAKTVCDAAFNDDKLLNGWKVVKNDGNGTYYLARTASISKSDSDYKVDPAFTNIQIPETFTTEDITLLGSFNIEVTGGAIQAAGFTDAEGAVTALFDIK